jgi:hypothetical protein
MSGLTPPCSPMSFLSTCGASPERLISSFPTPGSPRQPRSPVKLASARSRDSAIETAPVNRALAENYRSGDVMSIYERWVGAFGKPTPAIQAMYLLNGLPE